MGRNRFASNVAISMIWVLVVFGLILELVAIPTFGAELASSYIEYSNDGAIIQLQLTGLVFAGQFCLVVISLLLRRIRNGGLLENKSSNLATCLAISFMAIAVLFTGLLQWLLFKNTLPPFLSVFLFVSILLSVIASFVTFSLTQVLKEATKARLELESVI